MTDKQRTEYEISAILEQVETALITEAKLIKAYFDALTEQGLPKPLVVNLVRDYALTRWRAMWGAKND